MNIKIALLFIAILIAAATLFYTQDLVKKLQQNEREIAELFAEGIEYVANTTSPETDLTFLFDNIIKPIDFPLILTNAKDEVSLESSTDVRNIEIDSTLSPEQLNQFFSDKIREMDEIHKPIDVVYADSIVLQRIHFGDSELINQLKFYPYLQILIAALFIIIGYIGFSNVKRSEQSNIWVGMAKETAHQFGTPISSLMGWLEMLRMNFRDPDKVIDIADEISNDVEKLSKITYRFSKIGALPEIKTQVVFTEIEKVIGYFQRRMPQTSKSVKFSLTGSNEVCAKINSELFEWVIENLVKNALDAIDHQEGAISFHIKDSGKKVEIDVNDNGKGIEMKRRKDIFRPGYSTKRRGWGLGLSLSKRIIEVYHKGKIFVKNSAPGEGTTIKIILRKS